MSQKHKKSKEEEIALFRYSIIAPLIHKTSDNQACYFKDMAARVYTLPDGESRKFHWRTFKSWLRVYRRKGFDGLKPKKRTDQGISRLIGEELKAVICRKFQEFPTISVSALYRILVDDGSVRDGSPAEGTIRAYVNEHKLRPQGEPIVPRKKFEKPFVNDLWITDFLHGPTLFIDGKKRKVFLTAVIDDHSRFIVGSRWALQENTEIMELLLKEAFGAYGLPKRLYCDNGATYSSHHLQLICARLGIALIHSKPYDSPSRGKIERFFRTVRQMFLPTIGLNQEYTTAGFNLLFREWLGNDYHRRIHKGIEETPLDRFLEGSKGVEIRRIGQTELDRHFQQTFTRKVKNDATISFNSILYEVPPRYIGSMIELRHPTGEEHEIWLYENDAPVLKLARVNAVENSVLSGKGISFNSMNTQGEKND